MSDALTDISRDKERLEFVKKIHSLEKDFLQSPAKEKAVELIGLWKKLLILPRGYSTSPNTWLAYERIAMYKSYIDTGEIPNLRLHNNITSDTKHAEIFLRYGNGFIVKDALEGWISSAIYEITGKMPRYRNFRVKLILEDAEEITCKDCPKFSGYCGGIECNSINLQELKQRKENVILGKSICEKINI